MRFEVLLAVAVLVLFAVLLRTQYDRVVGEVTNPDPDATPIFPVSTPVVRPLCPGGGSDCLLFPTPDF